MLAGTIASLLSLFAVLFLEFGFMDGVTGSGWTGFLLGGVLAWLAYPVWRLTGASPSRNTPKTYPSDK
jgi:hypothetical protein